MSDWEVSWIVDIFDWGTPEEAAKAALCVQRDPNSRAVVFSVRNRDTEEEFQVDLDEAEEVP